MINIINGIFMIINLLSFIIITIIGIFGDMSIGLAYGGICNLILALFFMNRFGDKK